MPPLVRWLFETQQFKSLTESLKKHPTVNLPGLPEEFLVVLLEALAHALERPLIVVHQSLFHAQQLYDRFNQDTVRLYPQDEFLTLKSLEGQDVLAQERLSTLTAMMNQEAHTIITHPHGWLKPLPTPERITKNTFTYHKGDRHPMETLAQTLVHLGYQAVHAVEQRGEFARRGSLMDIYQIHYDHPIRVDFFDDEIDVIRVFDVSTQRSIKALDGFTLRPHRLLNLSLEERMTWAHHLRQTARNRQATSAQLEPIDALAHTLQYAPTIDALMPYAQGVLAHTTLKDYVVNPLVVWINTPIIEGSYALMTKELKRFKEEHKALSLLDPQWIDSGLFQETPQGLILNPFESHQTAPTVTWRIKPLVPYEHNLFQLAKDLRKMALSHTNIITLEDAKRRQKMADFCEENAIPFVVIGSHETPLKNRLNLLISDQNSGFEWLDEKLWVASEHHLFKRRKKKKTRYQTVLKDARKIESSKMLERGDYVVHHDHGIGRFMGLQTMKLKDTENEYMVISYHGDDTLYIPVENVHLIQKYNVPEGIVPKVHRLGGTEWAKTKQRARKKAKDVAEKLLKHYALRQKAEGFAFSPDTSLMSEFEADFPYEETVDQTRAIAEVKADMESAQPMDRLICGDVGYGKTEIALRAAFKAVLDNKQVAYLAPTTLLSRQHYYTFKERLSKHGIKVVLLNRFVDAKKQQVAVEGLAIGAVDVVIGTHRLLSSDVRYKDLGLLIVDEEQRFGVEHKEKIQSYRAHIDVLTLSATPIPRTLQMALSGVKQMSLLHTPPANRMPIQTYVMRRDDMTIVDAIEKEIQRRGQVFYLYNKVDGMDTITDHIQRLVPHAKIAYAHGQMEKRQLEKTIQAFLNQDFDVLISTTIIETGIDIPNANTLIVHDADHLGLAQLYQIRGRVGRSDRIAYSYMMFDPQKILTEEATKRLQSIRDFTELGSGYKIATRDMAIRGTGDILGTEQSGFIQTVGMDVFLEMVKEEIQLLKDPPKETPKPPLASSAKLKISKLLPDDYIASLDDKLSYHRRIADCQNSHEAEALLQEMTDRYGRVPTVVSDYVWHKVYERLAQKHDLTHLRQTDTVTTLTFSEAASSKLQGDRLFDGAYRIHPDIKLNYKQKKITVTLPHFKLPMRLHEALVILLETLED